MSPENKLSSVCIRVFFKVGNTEDGENLCHPICTLSDHTEKKSWSPLSLLLKWKYCLGSSK